MISSRSASACAPPPKLRDVNALNLKQAFRPGVRARFLRRDRACEQAARRISRVRQMASSFPCDPRFFVLILHLLPGAGFEGHQRQANVVLVDAEYHRLLLAVVVLKSNRQEVLPLLGQHEKRRDDDRRDVPAVHLLPVLEQVYPLIGHLHLGVFGDKDEVNAIGDPDFAGIIGRNVGPGATDVLRLAAVVMGRSEAECRSKEKQRTQRCASSESHPPE